jgi:hypothetical protein
MSFLRWLEGNWRWVVLFLLILAVLAYFYPDQVFFLFKFVWDLIVQNAKALYQNLFKH